MTSRKTLVWPASALLCASTALWACTTNTSIGGINTLPTQAALQLSVGTLNDSAGTYTQLVTGVSAAGIYLNAVTTFRNAAGLSAYPNPGSASLVVPGGASFSIGMLFSYGQAPGANFILGLPPAYPPMTNGTGFGTGFLVLAPSGGAAPTFTPATPGVYTASTSVSANGTAIPYNATAALPAAPFVVPSFAAPGFTSDGRGGGAFSVAAIGQSETLIPIYNSGAAGCSKPGAQAATLETTTATATLASGTLTTGNAYCAFALAADYPLLETGPPASSSARPALGSSQGTSDLSFSPMISFIE